MPEFGWSANIGMQISDSSRTLRLGYCHRASEKDDVGSRLQLPSTIPAFFTAAHSQHLILNHGLARNKLACSAQSINIGSNVIFSRSADVVLALIRDFADLAGRGLRWADDY